MCILFHIVICNRGLGLETAGLDFGLGLSNDGHGLGHATRSRSPGGLMLTQYMPNIFQTGRPTKFKLGIQTEHEE